MFADIYRGKRVLVTGHTGFKGSWLTSWLLKLDADVTGLSKDIPTTPSMFEEAGLAGRIRHVIGDVRDAATVSALVRDQQPDFVFHFAAQAIVSRSYTEPAETISTNVIGTMNVLEALRAHGRPCRAVLITSDKCYENVEWTWGYRENDRLGGTDIYGGSKAAAELIIRSYVCSFFSGDHPVRVAVGRAGNVIGGGDWARDRIVADCMRAWNEGRRVELRKPEATRPWQHVLEPLSGYLTLGEALTRRPDLHGQAFNFGPRAEQNRSVAGLIEDLGAVWGLSADQAYRTSTDGAFREAGLLKLNCDKALLELSWEPNLDYRETIRLVGEWYRRFYRDRPDAGTLTLSQIEEYESAGRSRHRVWAGAS